MTQNSPLASVAVPQETNNNHSTSARILLYSGLFCLALVYITYQISLAKVKISPELAYPGRLASGFEARAAYRLDPATLGEFFESATQTKIGLVLDPSLSESSESTGNPEVATQIINVLAEYASSGKEIIGMPLSMIRYGAAQFDPRKVTVPQNTQISINANSFPCQQTVSNKSTWYLYCLLSLPKSRALVVAQRKDQPVDAETARKFLEGLFAAVGN